MTRRARIRIAGIPFHVIQRGNNRSACFFAEKDYHFYLECLQEGAERYGCAIHAYMLMTNHVHLLISPAREDALSLVMRYLGSRYVHYVNDIYRRSGTLWEGRFKSSLVESERYLLTCYRYVESDPVRAHIVTSPADYRWSSYGYHAYGHADKLIQDHRLYLDLGATPIERQAAYCELFRHQLDEKEVHEIRNSVNRGLVLGEESFKDEIESVTARRVRLGKSGRPKKVTRSDVMA